MHEKVACYSFLTHAVRICRKHPLDALTDHTIALDWAKKARERNREFAGRLERACERVRRVLDNNINRRELRRAGRDFMRERERLLDELMFANP